MAKNRKNNLAKKILSITLALVMVLAGFGAIGTTPVYAEDQNGDGTDDSEQFLIRYVAYDPRHPDVEATLIGDEWEVWPGNGEQFWCNGRRTVEVSTSNWVFACWSDITNWTNLTGRHNMIGTFNLVANPGEVHTFYPLYGEDSKGDDGTGSGQGGDYEDGILDIRQIFIKYVTEDENMGTFTGTSHEVYSNTNYTILPSSCRLTFTTDGRTPVPNDGYVFSKWTEDLNNTSNNTGQFEYTDILSDKTITITAKFKKINYNGNIKDGSGAPVIPETPFDDPTDPNAELPEVGDLFTDENGDEYEIIDIGDPDPDTGNVPITVEKVVDENDDGIPDKYQVKVVYVSEDDTKGTVTGTTEMFPKDKPTSGTYNSEIDFTTTGASAEANDGYVFSKFVNSENDDTNANGIFELTNVDVNKTVTITGKFIAKSYGGDVKDEEGNPITPATDDPINDPTTTPEVGDVVEDEDGNLYEITEIDEDDADPDTGEVPIKVKGLTDEDGDGIPDKYQVTVKYVSEDASKGTVTGTTEKFPNMPSTTGKYESKISFTATGATAIANDGYVFSKFVNDVNNATNIDGKFAFTDVAVNKTITITGKFVAKSYAGNITDENNNPITPAADDPITDPTTKPEEGDVIVDKDGNPYEITNIDDENTDPETGEVPIKVKGLTDEDGDGIPDKYQVTVKYESADETMGTVTGATEKFPKEKSSKYTDKISFTATGATPNPKAGYAFVEFVNDKDDKTNTDGKFAFTEIEVQSTITIKATFVAKDFTNIKDEDGNPITPKDPLPSDPEPKEGDKFIDENGDPYEITDVGDTDPNTGDTPITVKPVQKNYDDVKDEDGNPVTPKPPFNDDDNKPEEGKRFIDENGDPYEITDIGETDPETGDTPITVKPVEKDYTDVKDDEGNPVTPKEPLGGDGNEPKVGNRFEDENGDEYEIVEVGPSDTDGNVPIKVKQVLTLTFDLDGGTLNGQTGTFTVKELKNNSFVIPKEAPTKDGYEFDYWEGSRYNPGDTYVVKDNHKFTAKWKETTTEDASKVYYTDIKDEDGNPVTPKDGLKEPKAGDKFTDISGVEYEIVSVGEPDPTTGVAKVIVKKVGDASDGSSGDGSGDGASDGAGGNSGQGDSASGAGNNGSAKTGDESNMTLWIMIFGAAVVASLALGRVAKRKE